VTSTAEDAHRHPKSRTDESVDC